MAADENNLRLTDGLKSFSRWNGAIIVLGGGTVLLGWVLKSELLKRVLPGLVAMNPVTALGFIMAGASLLCFWRAERRSSLARHGQALAGIVAGIGAVKLAAYLFDLHFPFDQLLFANQIRNDPTGVTNQIAPNTALNFLITGAVLFRLHSTRRTFSRWVQNLSLALAFISLVPLVGYIYRASYLYGIGSYIPMALHTAAFFYFLAHGLLLAQSDSGVVALFTSKTPGGAIARRLLPFAFSVPLVLGALAIWGVKTGLYPSELGVTIVVVGSAAVFTGLIWRNARLLNRADRHRRLAEEQLKQAHDELELRVQERTARLNETNQSLCLRITELQNAQEKISEQAELLNKAQDAILVLDARRRVVFWNKGAERLYGWSAEAAAGKVADELLFKDTASVEESYRQVLHRGTWTGELQQVTHSGQAVTVESRWTLVKDPQGRPKCILIINTNVTEKKNYEAQMLRSQRMESIGALAGGVAHDLNNALTPVIIGTQLLRESPKAEDRERLLDMVSSGAQRGREMVKQILSFARGSRGQAGPVQLQHLITEMAKIVRDTFPKSISVQVNRKQNLWTVQGDVTELHQVLLNLCVNARDAMPDGGRLTIKAENLRLSEDAVLAAARVPAGSYVLLGVADTGSGIPTDVLPRIFEPFFTTKAPDKGTGLGLSTVASILKHHHGFVEIQSEVGQGTEFKIYLPATESTEANASRPVPAELPVGHGELILVMDDEEVVCELAKTTLENYGYRVVSAANGVQGIACFERDKNEIKVLVTDTDMPFMDGLDAIRAIQRVRADLPIIIASGARRDPGRLQHIDTTRVTMLNKPYTVEELLKGVAAAVSGVFATPSG